MVGVTGGLVAVGADVGARVAVGAGGCVGAAVDALVGALVAAEVAAGRVAVADPGPLVRLGAIVGRLGVAVTTFGALPVAVGKDVRAWATLVCISASVSVGVFPAPQADRTSTSRNKTQIFFIISSPQTRTIRWVIFVV